MRITRQLEDLKLEQKPVVIAAGYFDGVHRGHQQVINEAVKKASALGGVSWILTFDPHPQKILKPLSAPPLITSTPHKLELFAQQGVDGCVVMPFTRQLADEEPETFIEQLKQKVPKLSDLVMGDNWTFGHKGRGNVDLMKTLAPKHAFRFDVVGPIVWKGSPISSSRIRQAISRGQLQDATEMLGRPFSILGTVIKGKGIGSRIGFPTANLDPHNEVRPPSGVYATRVNIHGRSYNGAAFVANPTDAQTTPSGFILEVHILDFEENLYGEDIEVFFIQKMRDVRRFASRMLLKDQIARDVQEIRAVLEKEPSSSAKG